MVARAAVLGACPDQHANPELAYVWLKPFAILAQRIQTRRWSLTHHSERSKLNATQWRASNQCKQPVQSTSANVHAFRSREPNTITSIACQDMVIVRNAGFNLDPINEHPRSKPSRIRMAHLSHVSHNEKPRSSTFRILLVG